MRAIKFGSLGAPLVAFGKRRGREASYFVAGVLVSVAIVSSAQYAASSTTSQPCALDAAMQDAVNKKIQIIGMTSPDPGKYFSAGSADSCFGDISLASLDLSLLIPDPIGLMTTAITAAIDKLKEMAIKKVCSAVRGAVGDVIGRYNYAINSVNGLDGGAIVGNLIDSKIGDLSRQAMDGYAMNWQTGLSSSSSRDVLSGLLSSSSSSSSGHKSTGSVPTGTVTLLNQNAADASSFTVAAGNLEAARIKLMNAQSRLTSAQSVGIGNMVASAEEAVKQAQAQYDQAKAAADSAQTSVMGSGASPAQTSTGSAVFSRAR